MTAPDDDIFAGEYVLGLLEGPERTAAEARLAADPAFAELVEDWAVRLEPMLAATPVEPPEAVWQRISARLAANDDAPAGTGGAVRRWRLATIGASVIAASLAFILVTRPAPELPPTPQLPPVATAPQPVLVASLADEKTDSAVTISVDGSGGRLLVTPVRLPADGRDPELWIIPEDGTPRSLGVIPVSAVTRVAVAPQHQAHIHSGATFAITMEPVGGSPSGAPTGPITASGKIIPV
jgi:anti-sigma-K factor RskA